MKNKEFVGTFMKFLQERFDLGEDRAADNEVIENIKRGVVIRGANLWVLIFAIVVASVGLNVNSTAVIIGAMLISPLMGPIMGFGLSLGIYDFELMKKSLRNFVLAVIISLIASTIYFAITPLSVAQSELLARTQPSVWDVLIAFFGGLAGVVAQTRKDRTSTVIPGVAIATALMPPLCTAGYGLGTGQLNYSFGALFLFLINAVFISLSAFFLVRFLKYEKRQMVDKAQEKRIRGYMALVIVLMVVPSVLFAYRIVGKTIFEANVQQYVTESFGFNETQVIDYKSRYNSDGKTLEVILVGKHLSPDVITQLKERLAYHKLSDVQLTVRHADGESYKDGSANFEKLYEVSSSLLEEKNKEISQLQALVNTYRHDTLPSHDIAREFGMLISTPKRFAISKAPVYNEAYNRIDSILICYVKMPAGKDSVSDEELSKISKWLKARTKSQDVKIIIEK